MKSQHRQKLKTPPRQLFSCAFFRNCTQSTLSPTTLSPSHPPPSSPPRASPPLPPPPPPLKRCSTRPESSSSSSSSSSASHSFTQWKFPLPNSPIHQLQNPNPGFAPVPVLPPAPRPQIPASNLRELFHVAQLQLTMGSDTDQIAALQCLERCLVPNPPSDPTCPPELMRGIVLNLKSPVGAKPATKVLLALCLAEGNRRVAVESGAVGAVVEAAMELEGPTAERALAALELMCTVAEGAAELRAHALVVPVMVSVMGRLEGRGREYAISVISVIYGGGGGGRGSEGEYEAVGAPPEEVARAVVLALQGECTARGKRKGAQLLKTLDDFGRLNLTQDGNQQL